MIKSLYKAREPFMDVESGYGYQGVVLYDDTQDKVQCHICGRWFEQLSNHAVYFHKISSRDYRIRFGLPAHGGLVSKRVSRIHNKRQRTLYKNGISDACASKRKCGDKRKFSNRKVWKNNGRTNMAHKNRHGLCEAQMAARWEVVKNIVKREPVDRDLERHDAALRSAIRYNYGSTNSYRKQKGISILRYSRFGVVPNDLQLIAQLRKWKQKHGKEPSSLDFKLSRGEHACSQTFIDRFGSWRQALTAAGLHR